MLDELDIGLSGCNIFSQSIFLVCPIFLASGSIACETSAALMCHCAKCVLWVPIESSSSSSSLSSGVLLFLVTHAATTQRHHHPIRRITAPRHRDAATPNATTTRRHQDPSKVDPPTPPGFHPCQSLELRLALATRTARDARKHLERRRRLRSSIFDPPHHRGTPQIPAS